MVAGQVLRRTDRDSVPVAGVRVILHRVGQDVQGPIDSVTSDAAGRFRLQFRPDTGALYLVSARYVGVEYFAPPLLRDAQHPDRDLRLMVYDTSSNVTLALASRHLVVGAVEPSGSRTVADLILIGNSGIVTRLAGDSMRPAWKMLLPSRAQSVELGEGDFAADAVSQRADTLLLIASIPPGTREFTLTYRIPADVSRFEIPLDHDVPLADILTEDARMVVRGGLVRRDTVTVVGRQFTKWDGALRAGQPLVLEFPVPSGRSAWLLPALIALLGAGLLGLGLASSRRAVRAPAPAVAWPAGLSPEAESLLDRIVALDAANVAGPGGMSASDWQAYQRERSRLKDELAAHLPR